MVKGIFEQTNVKSVPFLTCVLSVLMFILEVLSEVGTVGNTKAEGGNRDLRIFPGHS